VSVFVIGVSVAGVLATADLRAEERGARAAMGPLALLQTARYTVAQEHAAISDFLLHGRQSAVDIHVAAVRDMTEVLASLRSGVPRAWVPAITRLTAEHRGYLLVATREIGLIQQKRHVEAELLDRTQLDPPFVRMTGDVEALESLALTSANDHMRQMNDGADSLGAATPIVLGICWLLGLGCFLVLRRYQHRLRRLAETDALTGLANRPALRRGCEQMLADAHNGRAVPVVLLLDLDRFKEVNDTLGHHVGDELLVLIAQRIQGMLAATSLVARLGGDEFAVVLPDGGASTGETVAKRLRQALQHSFVVDGLALEIDVSIGIAEYSPGETAPSLLRRADVAMYVAKETQTGARVYTAELDDHTTDRLALIGEMRHALDHDELVVHYQPKVSVSTGAVLGAEALVRWQHPRLGLLAPGQFIPRLETTAVIDRLTIEVLAKALRQCREWLVRGWSIPVAVNVSSRCFLDSTFPRTVIDLLTRFGLSADMLILEITETTVITDPPTARLMMNQLHEHGVRLSVDDFGTGYATLAYLRDLPLSEIKIDRQFITDLAHSDSDAALVRSVVELGHSLGLTVVAEGIEDQAALDRLRTLDCDLAQGYAIGRPMDPGAIDAWLTRRHHTTAHLTLTPISRTAPNLDDALARAGSRRVGPTTAA